MKVLEEAFADSTTVLPLFSSKTNSSVRSSQEFLWDFPVAVNFRITLIQQQNQNIFFAKTIS